MRKRDITLCIPVIVEPDGSHRFHAYTPALPGLHVDGRTKKQTVRIAVRAVTVYLDSLARYHDPLPVGPNLTARKMPTVPKGASLHIIKVQWPSLRMFGIS